jgi:hypothetical protein
MVRVAYTHQVQRLTYSPADVTTVKVPEMAESITEGTLKQWSKRTLPMFESTGFANMPQRSVTTSSRTRRSPPLRQTRLMCR